MEKEELKILIEMVQETSNVFWSFYNYTYTDKRRNLLDKIGVRYEVDALLKEFKIEYGENKKIENWLKKNLPKFLETMDKTDIGYLAKEYPGALGDDVLKEILTTEIVEWYDEYNLTDEDLAKILLAVNDVEYKKKILDYVREQYDGDPEDTHFSEQEIVDILISTNDIEYIKKYIEEGYYSEEYFSYEHYSYDLDTGHFSNYNLEKLLKFINDYDYIKEILDKGTYDLKSRNIASLVEFMNDVEYTQKVLDNRENYKLEGDEFLELSLLQEINKLDDANITSFIDKLKKSKRAVINIVTNVNKKEFTEKIVKNWKEIGFQGYEIKDLLSYVDNIEEIIINRKKYDLSSEIIADVVSRKGKKEELLKLVDKETSIAFRQNNASIQYIREYLEMFMKLEGVNIEIDKILKMAEKNEGILKGNFNILDNRYINALGEEKINQISCYPEIVEKILELNNEELNLIGKVLDRYMQEGEVEEWTPLANRILENISSYGELISNLKGNKEFDVSELIPILMHSNDFDIKTLEDVENFSDIKRRKCEELINAETIEKKQEGILLKIFGQGREETKKLIEKFGEDIDKIENENLKDYIKCLQEILKIEDGDVLEKIFQNVDEIETLNPLLMERRLKTEYFKLYKKDLFKAEDAKILSEEDNMYSAGTDFKMIITSVGAYCKNNILNYEEDWNRASISSQHFCASYIRNDMLGHARVPFVCYGFEDMQEDSLMLSGAKDIYSSAETFESEAYRGERYLSPDNQIKNTSSYNEMDFRRIQGGVKKQPDYIVLFKKYGDIPNLTEAKKASKDFGDLPIIVIDVEECLMAEKQKVENLFERYKETGDIKIREQLEVKLRNNRVTDEHFCQDTNIDDELKRLTTEDREVTIEDLEEIYGETTSRERQEESSKILEIYRQIKEISRGEMQGGETGGRE